MTIKKIDEIILICDVCGEPLKARAVFVQKRQGKGRVLQSRPKLFCPECDKDFSIITRFKKQYAQKKANQKN